MVTNLPQRLAAFIDDGRTDRSGESFQGRKFHDFDQTGRTPISFFRSDFRKTQMINCVFRGNNFARCDFISSIFSRTKFIDCDFMSSSIMYSVFQDCVFENNVNFNPDLFRCRLVRCQFARQLITRVAWRDTEFVACDFAGSEIERSTLQNLQIAECNLNGVDLSQASVTDLHFVRSSLVGVAVDPDYLGTYSFEDTDLSSIRFAYRSKNLDLSFADAEDFVALAAYLEGQQRWSEAFNILAILFQVRASRPHSSILENEWQRCLLGALDLEIAADSAENVRRLFRLAKHYLAIGFLSVSGSLRLLAAADLISRQPLNSLVLEEMKSGLASFSLAIETLPNIEDALSADADSRIPVRFQVLVDTDDEALAKEGFRTFLEAVAAKQGIPFAIIKLGAGSIVIEAATWFVVVMLFFRAARAAGYALVEIRLIFKAGNRLAQLVDQSSKPKDIFETVKTLHRTLPKEKAATDLVQVEVVELGRTFRDLMHQAKLGGIEFLALVREVRIFINDLRKPN